MNEDRGMMKWAPYQSLIEQATSLARMRHARKKVEKPQIAQERAEEINNLLCHYQQEEVDAYYWQDGFMHHALGIIEKIDPVFRFLKIDGLTIPFKNLVNLSYC